VTLTALVLHVLLNQSHEPSFIRAETSDLQNGTNLAAERRKYTSTLSRVGLTPPPRRAPTPAPESRERATETGLDARDVGTRTDSPTGDTIQSPANYSSAPRSAERRITDRFSSLAPMPLVSRELPTEPAGEAEEAIVLESTQSVGYYSLRPSRVDALRIPKAPRLPNIGFESGGAQVSPHRAAVPSASLDRRATDATSLAGSAGALDHPATIRTPAPYLDSKSSAPSAEAVVGQSSRPPGIAGPASGAPSRSPLPASAPRVYFAPHLRSQANQWLKTGSLSLPGCSSPRHARALQRALLAALLHEPGWSAMPDGLRQRAGWLFCEGWESGSEKGHAFREIDDLATVLGLPCTPESRRRLSLAISASLPEGPPSRRHVPSVPPSGRE
jgi:hypothetical protein